MSYEGSLQRGMLDETLVVWGGEFGRQPVYQGNGGRDHNPKGFTSWLAGGGVRAVTSYGETGQLDGERQPCPKWQSLDQHRAQVSHHAGGQHASESEVEDRFEMRINSGGERPRCSGSLGFGGRSV